MKRLGIALLSLLSVLTATAPLSARTSDRTALSLPGIPNSRVPSGGVVNTLFPAATGGRAPYEYSLSGLPPGITFSPSTRVASGTLPTVWIETAYTIVYTVRDRAGASASVTFTATVRPPASVPPLSLPGIPNSRVPSGGVVNTLFPAATGGRAPYEYSLSGQPPGITFSPSTRVASGTLPTVWIETAYTIVYTVRDRAGASASVTFTATVRPPASVPPLSLPGIPNSRVPSGGVVNTLFPAATGGRAPYEYSLSGLPPGITFSPSTRVASGTLPTVTTDTTYTITYSVRDSRGATDSTSFTATVTARQLTVVMGPPRLSPPTEDPDPPPPATVVRVYSLPFTVSETGEGEKSYRFELDSRTEVSLSLTGMNRDIDCRVNGSSCTNRGGTSDDSWNGTLDAGTHSVTVYPYGGGSGNWTLSVSGTATSPPPPAPTPTPPPPPAPTPTPPPPTTGSGPIVKTGVNVSSSRTYLLRLSGRVEVSVELTGMTIDFDCKIGSSNCTNRWGTADDSWSGTLDAGDHKIVVYPYRGGSGNYTLTVSARVPSTGGSTGTRTQVTTLVDVSRTGVSTSQTHGFTLSGPAEVDVSLTGLTIDFDCRVGSSNCTNRGITLDDSWNGNLAAGNHSVEVYPYATGAGNYSLTVTATETLTGVGTPLGGGPPRIRLVLCDENDGRPVAGTCREVVTGGGPGQGTPGPGGGGDGGDGGGGGGGGDDDDDDDEETPAQQLDNAVADAITRSRTCSIISNDERPWNANAALTTARDAGLIIIGGLDCPGPAAYVPVLNRDQIRVCEGFFELSPPEQSLTIMHEGFHLAGAVHSNFGEDTASDDHGPMEAAIKSACGY